MRQCKLPGLSIIQILIIGVVLSQIIQSILNSSPNRHDYGSFYNSGPYACYLAVGLPIALRMMASGSNRLQKWIGMGMVIMIAILIPASLSRTALIACVVGGSIALYDVIKVSIKDIPCIRIVSLSVLLVVGAGVIYLIKQDSADGRFLMWKVAAMAAKDAPVSGVGWENVAGAYGNAQEQYFASGRGSEQEIMVADAPQYVFNEYLQVAIAYGSIVSLVLIFIIIGGIIVALRNNNYAFAGSVAAVAIVMFASYPLQFPLFAVTIAIILSGAWLSARHTSIGRGMTGIIVAMCALFLSHNETANVDSDFSVAHTLHKMHDYRKSNTILLNLLPHTADPMPLNIIGKNYRALGMPDSAEHYLARSTHRCPNRLYPHYLLMQLYGDSIYNKPESRRREAEYLLNTREKIPSRAVNEMREEATAVLKTLSTKIP